MAVFRGRATYSNVVATIALFVALGGGAYAAAGSLIGSGGAIAGCVPKNGGALVVVKPHHHCPRGTVPLNFNAQGPSGRQGPPGSNATINGVPAGGDLTGRYPAPTIAPGAVSTSKFAPGAVAPNAAALGGQGASAFGAVMTARLNNVSSTANTTDFGSVVGITNATSLFGAMRTQSPAFPLFARDLSVHATAIGGGERTIALDVDGNATALTCALGPSVGNCTDTSDVVAIPANSQLDISDEVGPTGAPGGSDILVSFRLTSS